MKNKNLLVCLAIFMISALFANCSKNTSNLLSGQLTLHHQGGGQVLKLILAYEFSQTEPIDETDGLPSTKPKNLWISEDDLKAADAKIIDVAGFEKGVVQSTSSERIDDVELDAMWTEIKNSQEIKPMEIPKAERISTVVQDRSFSREDLQQVSSVVNKALEGYIQKQFQGTDLYYLVGKAQKDDYHHVAAYIKALISSIENVLIIPQKAGTPARKGAINNFLAVKFQKKEFTEDGALVAIPFCFIPIKVICE